MGNGAQEGCNEKASDSGVGCTLLFGVLAVHQHGLWPSRVWKHYRFGDRPARECSGGGPTHPGQKFKKDAGGGAGQRKSGQLPQSAQSRILRKSSSKAPTHTLGSTDR